MPKPAYYALCQCVILQLRHFPGLNMDSKSRFILWNVFAQKKITTLLFCHTDILFLLNLRRKIYLFLSMVCLVCFMLSAGSLNSWKIENEIWTKQLKTRKSTKKNTRLNYYLEKLLFDLNLLSCLFYAAFVCFAKSWTQIKLDISTPENQTKISFWSFCQ